MKSLTSPKNQVYYLLYLVLIGIIVSLFLLDPTETESFSFLRILIITFASILLTKYFIFMMLSPWNEVWDLRKNKSFDSYQGDHMYQPFVSVIVPAWNEEDGILTTIKALLKSTYKNMEILVIDNASTDRTRDNVNALITNNSIKELRKPYMGNRINIKYLYEPRQGKGHALNTGLATARGSIIISIDADCYVPAETIQNFVKYFKDPSVMAVVGNVRIGNTETIIGVVQYLEFLFSFYFKKAEALVNTIYIIGGAAGGFRREVFDKIGHYSTSNITEDIEMSVRIQAEGMRIAYAPDALVYTEGAVTLDGLIKQRLRWKRGRFETFFNHRYLFFSLKKKHGKLLSWVVLPFAIFGDLQLSLEIIFISFLYIFALTTGDFTSFISGIVVVSSMFFVQVAFDNHRESTLGFLLLAPIGWLLFYISTYVETCALFKALWGYINKQELTWQKWERRGVFTD